MKKFGKTIGIIAVMAVVGILVTACDGLFGDNSGIRGTIRVNNQGAARSANNEELVELYIYHFKLHGSPHFCENTLNHGFKEITIVNPWTPQNTPKGWTGPVRNYWNPNPANEGWFSYGQMIDITYVHGPDRYTVILLGLDYMRIGGKSGELYPFPPDNRAIVFGTSEGYSNPDFPEAFPGGLVVEDSTELIIAHFTIDLDRINEFWVKQGNEWIIREGKNPYELITVFAETR